MKIKPTKCTVRLRKAEFKKEWYVYVESYPVYVLTTFIFTYH